MFAVDDIEDVLARLRAHGAELVGEVAQYTASCWRYRTYCGYSGTHERAEDNSYRVAVRLPLGCLSSPCRLE